MYIVSFRIYVVHNVTLLLNIRVTYDIRIQSARALLRLLPVKLGAHKFYSQQNLEKIHLSVAARSQ